MRNTVTETLLTAAVNSHLADPQGKWSMRIQTSALLDAFVAASGVPYWFANLAMHEKCADHWLNCLAEVAGVLNPNLASHQFSVREASTRSNGTERVNLKAHRISGEVNRIVIEFINPFSSEEIRRRDAMTEQQKTHAFFVFLYRKIAVNPDLFSGYDPEVTKWAKDQIAQVLSAAEVAGIDYDLQREAEARSRAIAEAKARREAEDAERAKREAARAKRAAARSK